MMPNALISGNNHVQAPGSVATLRYAGPPISTDALRPQGYQAIDKDGLLWVQKAPGIAAAWEPLTGVPGPTLNQLIPSSKALGGIRQMPATMTMAAGSVYFAAHRIERPGWIHGLICPINTAITAVSIKAAIFNSEYSYSSGFYVGKPKQLLDSRLTFFRGSSDGDGNFGAETDFIDIPWADYRYGQVQQVNITGTPTGGTFKLGFGREGGAVVQTAAIAYNANAAAVQAALDAVATIGAGTSVSGTNPNFSVTLPTTTPYPYDLMTLADNSLTGGTSPSVTIGTNVPLQGNSGPSNLGGNRVRARGPVFISKPQDIFIASILSAGISGVGPMCRLLPDYTTNGVRLDRVVSGQSFNLVDWTNLPNAAGVLAYNATSSSAWSSGTAATGANIDWILDFEPA